MPRARPILVVQHEGGCPPGHLLPWAHQCNVVLDVRACHRGAPLPPSLSEHSGLILLGGEMGAYDDARHPWLSAAKSLVIQSVIQSIPFLGLCLGHQLAAVALGGRVGANPEGPSRGIFPVRPLALAGHDPIMAALPANAAVVHWNSDVVTTVPGGATVLARDAQGQVQILRFAEHAWGIQGHPEVDAAIVAGWGRDPAPPAAAGGPGSDDIVALLETRQDELERIWRPVAKLFFAATRRPGLGPGGRSVVPLPPPPNTPSVGRIHHR